MELPEATSAVDAHARWQEWHRNQYNKEQITFVRLSQEISHRNTPKIVWIAHYTIDTRWSGLRTLGIRRRSEH